MSNGKPAGLEKSFFGLFVEHPIKTAGAAAALLLVVPLGWYFDHMLFPSVEHSLLAFLVAVAYWYISVLTCTLLSIFTFNRLAVAKAAADQTSTKKAWEDALAKLCQAYDTAQKSSKEMREEHAKVLGAAQATIEQKLRALGEERLAFEQTREDIKRRLEQEKRNFAELVKIQHDWLYTDDKILELEAETDSEISVLAPDFFYEQQPQYERVIIKNLAKPASPTYDYFVLDSAQNRGALRDLRERLEQGLQACGCVDVKATMKSRFRVHLIPDREFPHCVGYGLAIYRFADQSKNRCLIYWPKEIGSWNLDILAAGKQGDAKKIVDATTTHLQDMAHKYPTA